MGSGAPLGVATPARRAAGLPGSARPPHESPPGPEGSRTSPRDPPPLGAPGAAARGPRTGRSRGRPSCSRADSRVAPVEGRRAGLRVAGREPCDLRAGEAQRTSDPRPDPGSPSAARGRRRRRRRGTVPTSVEARRGEGGGQGRAGPEGAPGSRLAVRRSGSGRRLTPARSTKLLGRRGAGGTWL